MTRKKNRSGNNQVYVTIIIFMGVIAFVSNYYRLNVQPHGGTPFIPVPNEEYKYHVHADFIVVINGQEVDFQRPEYDFANPLIHLHVQNYMGGRVIHVESGEVRMKDFFESLNMGFNSTCFSVIDERYCSNSTHSLKFYVNGVKNNQYENYKPQDLDRILITYGNESEKEIEEQINSVTNESCIYSEKCPERGAAPEEKSCLTSGECPPERS